MRIAALAPAALSLLLLFVEPAWAAEAPAARLLALINNYRAEHGRRLLAADERLAWIAGTHGADMARQGYFGHVAPDGSDLARRLRQAGYRFVVAAENLARGYPDAIAVVDGWRASPGHDANLLRADVSRAGVAVVAAEVKDAGPIWVLVLAEPPR
jgi:uncharacterized protein YkwD